MCLGKPIIKIYFLFFQRKWDAFWFLNITKIDRYVSGINQESVIHIFHKMLIYSFKVSKKEIDVNWNTSLDSIKANYMKVNLMLYLVSLRKCSIFPLFFDLHLTLICSMGHNWYVKHYNWTMDGHLTTTQSGSKKRRRKQHPVHWQYYSKREERQMGTDIRFIMSSQQTENSVGLHQKKKVMLSFWPIIERRNNEVFWVEMCVSKWVCVSYQSCVVLCNQSKKVFVRACLWVWR